MEFLQFLRETNEMWKTFQTLLTRVFSCGSAQYERIDRFKKEVNDLRDRFEIIDHTVTAWRSSIGQLGPLSVEDKVRMVDFNSSYLYITLVHATSNSR